MLPTCRQRLKKSSIMVFISISGLFSSLLLGQTCSVKATPMNFGNYDGFSTSNLDSSSTIAVTCNPNTTSFTIALDGGLNGSVNNRTMTATNGNDRLTYNLYSDASRSIIWGNGSGNTQTVTGNSPFPITVYGRVSPAQNASVGGYNDTVTITVNF